MRTSIRIPLPDMMRNEESKIHPYPFRIAMQTLEFMQGSLFHASILDTAAGAYMRQPDGLTNLARIYIEKLDTPKTWDEVWGILGKYQSVFEKAPLQSVLIAMNSHWDWYARKLMNFILFARQDLSRHRLEKVDEKRLVRFSSLPISEQLEVIQLAAEIALSFDDEDVTELMEMALVRNLGLHNRWEIDERYLERTKNHGYQLGELRVVDIEEIRKWHLLFCRVVTMTSREVAFAFVNAKNYP